MLGIIRTFRRLSSGSVIDGFINPAKAKTVAAKDSDAGRKYSAELTSMLDAFPSLQLQQGLNTWK